VVVNRALGDRKRAGVLLRPGPLQRLLSELEVGFVFATVIELEDQLAGLPAPRFLSLPHVNVLVARGIVGEAARSCSNGLLDVVQWAVRVGGYRSRLRVALREDV
jgi:hypothetical protein